MEQVLCTVEVLDSILQWFAIAHIARTGGKGSEGMSGYFMYAYVGVCVCVCGPEER